MEVQPLVLAALDSLWTMIVVVMFVTGPLAVIARFAERVAARG